MGTRYRHINEQDRVFLRIKLWIGANAQLSCLLMKN